MYVCYVYCGSPIDDVFISVPAAPDITDVHVDLTSLSSSTMVSCLSHIESTSASFLYVLAAPFFCFHIHNIDILCAGTEKGAWPTMFSTSVCVSPSAGAISLHSAMCCDIWHKCWSEHCSSHGDTVTVGAPGPSNSPSCRLLLADILVCWHVRTCTVVKTWCGGKSNRLHPSGAGQFDGNIAIWGKHDSRLV